MNLETNLEELHFKLELDLEKNDFDRNLERDPELDIKLDLKLLLDLKLNLDCQNGISEYNIQMMYKNILLVSFEIDLFIVHHKP